jgi:hypothetical protein
MPHTRILKALEEFFEYRQDLPYTSLHSLTALCGRADIALELHRRYLAWLQDSQIDGDDRPVV